MTAPRHIGRKILLSLTATVLFFVVLELVLAVVGVEPVLYERDPYIGFSSFSPLFVEQPGSDGSELITARNKLTLFNEQRFPADKGDSYRIFCVGGSTTFGRPYDDSTSFCGWLRELLPVADPGREWEVINAGGVSYASYRVAILMEELVEYDPDLFIIYSGHNEFLERRSYPQIIAMPEVIRGAGAVAARTRTYGAMSSVIGRVTGRRGDPESNPSIIQEEVTTLLDDAVGPSAYTRDDELAARILEHYRFNLARMTDIAASAGAQTLLVTPVSNLRDSRPFKSEHGESLEPGERERFDSLLKSASLAHAEGRIEESIADVQTASAIDPRHAQLAFLQGRLLGDAQRWPEARRAFERARDEDICPLRALSSFPAAVREIARQRGVPMVDFDVLADERAEHGIPGADLFYDHVHPTIEVHRMLALEIITILASQGIVSPDPDWGEEVAAEVVAKVEGALDAQTHALALMKLSKVLGWAGKLQESHRLAERAVGLYPDDARIQYNAGLTAHLVGLQPLAVAHYRRAVEIQPDADEPHGNLGVLLEQAGELEAAIHHYRMAVRHARITATALRNSSNLANALMLQGYRDYTEGRLSDALTHLGEAAELAPNEPEILGRLGIAQLAALRTTEAIATFERALEVRPDDPTLLNRLALTLALDGQVDRAAEIYGRAIALDSRVGDLPDNLFRVLATMGRTELTAELEERLGE